MFEKEPFTSGATTSAFSVRVSALSFSYAAAVRQAIGAGLLDAEVRGGECYVSRYDLLDLAGPMADQDDPAGGCYIPPEAVVQLGPS
ncbi:hypothetical protein SAMN05192580_2193 [Sphingomonas jatrophae]|uniref:Uncharacterized protein n=1 Tax=Sphingomonas jatrophae TaxID=1166337 RepID=A0A1I6L2I9_9SPHN|nr:hypothetical protein SAMN05192580_2193 [Sphingomonas jatrophae]